MPAVFDFVKVEKEYYTARAEPEEIMVPPMKFIMAQGMCGTGNKKYHVGVETVYALATIIRDSKKGGRRIPGYFEYKIPPLESYFWGDLGRRELKIPRHKWLFCCMLRQPDFVEEADFAWAREACARTYPELDTAKVRFWTYTEGYSVQILHTGPRSRETASIKKIKAYMDAHRMREGWHPVRKHHEIYLNDAAKTDPEKLKTILRLPVIMRY
ncbi:MAG: GyrI-like domain-containing protein [Spirochaetaceae bacterium]|jgi:hypothetical protein|nr:GyrI-like domain-containing protein [Spirochaetaceae bacterium]